MYAIISDQIRARLKAGGIKAEPGTWYSDPRFKSVAVLGQRYA